MALIRFEQFDPVNNLLTLQQELDRRSILAFQDRGPIRPSTSSTIVTAC